MSVSVTMPRLGESVSEGTVIRWLKKEGERVEADEPLLEVSTDKVDTEIPAPASGVISAIRVAEDETVEVGVELAVIDEGAAAGQDARRDLAASAGQTPAPAVAVTPPPPVPPAAAPAPAPVAARTPPAAVPAQEFTPAQAAETPANGNGSLGAYVTPLVRRLAAEHDVDLSAVTGTGIGGRIRKQDVIDAARTPADAAATPTAPAPAVTPAPAVAPARAVAAAPASVPPVPAPAPVSLRGRTEKMSRLRSVIAQRMVESLQVSAQLTTVVEADVTRVARLRDRAKAAFEAREGVKLSFLPFFAVAVCAALREYPNLNASVNVEQGTITYYDTEHLGIAVDTDRGLLVPVIHHAGDLNLTGMARKIDDLATRTRDNRVSPDELGGGTFTLTNTGSRGALFDTPIINQPQVGILGTGSVVKRPAVVDDPELGEIIAVRSKVYLALTYDHRIVDGADAARFLTAVRRRLEEGAFEAELGQ
ncbi:2-oxoglutarate dehydrogenase, E2 component, dihydrolipoamide succinyltransferase [Frankia sp. CiP3]|uniref:2-oxoglutarate dehydrogenase, E2 component, dihydrolipoamide succinyltransferase n=1 Tax=Frankia sp. CiP3 TaxID=2880971 RepID=UPI001EF5B442|nr:2-oxoglutarate dehydrogenase, E2 component, dihydrolipoamide succinyltransferase [Frankia sp. CiP3]